MANNFALVIGVNHYEHLHQARYLNYAVGDAERIKEFLCNQAGFKPDNVLLCSDNSEPISSRQIPTRPNRSNLRRLLLDEIQSAKGADNFWFFFSGHGMIGSDNHDYLMPRDGYGRDLEGTAIPVDFVIRCLMNCQAKNVVMILDMCRCSDGSKGFGDVGAYTAEKAKQQGIITIFSCSRGEESYEIPELKQGAFTYALLEGLTNHGTPGALEQYLQHRVPELNRYYGKPHQFPQISLNSVYKYDFPLLPNLSDQVRLIDTGFLQEDLFSQSVPTQNAKNAGHLLNQKLVEPLLLGAAIFDFKVVTLDPRGYENNCYQGQAQYFIENLDNRATLEMVYIPGGTFLMGSSEMGRGGQRYSSERPQHSVAVKPFLISKYPITQAHWREVASLPEVHRNLNLRPSRPGGKSHPVTQVSWHDAVEFCCRLSQKTGHEYRLPTEAEWEYACRAGTTTPFHFGETINSYLANYDGRYPYGGEGRGTYRKKTSSVGTSESANAFGLFDMHGNVWEWCLDHWHENYDDAPITGEAWIDDSNNQKRLIRGGSWFNEPFLCRSASRWYGDINQKSHNIGFRIIRSL
ncbi:SUMF1/EgtB/PvdO family nonheme iron enzyme [Microcoleus sp. FACHB-SPT15]|uniref:SUMF1/EgtB/PvdO family nonheme iron enzyme n=1 Tax=Microcoleus sp. FACHB-SPT15 TaxID=2692830 RepID=UPI001781B0C0|nr:SUMF1/EgtB/PvdO family nonheme iron enzyme [Microcoleus sp. FACHB-SPT15]MBD1808857.1 SUMF1/EgtB/PvdO family nonheme iron enzyme [Microcoleus sp. FACHB-SPT15]